MFILQSPDDNLLADFFILQSSGYNLASVELILQSPDYIQLSPTANPATSLCVLQSLDDNLMSKNKAISRNGRKL